MLWCYIIFCGFYFVAEWGALLSWLSFASLMLFFVAMIFVSQLFYIFWQIVLLFKILIYLWLWIFIYGLLMITFKVSVHFNVSLSKFKMQKVSQMMMTLKTNDALTHSLSAIKIYFWQTKFDICHFFFFSSIWVVF